jgi:hypothetical protein
LPNGHWTLRELPKEEAFEEEINGSEVYEPDTKRVLFVVFQSHCHLAILLTEMVSILFGGSQGGLPQPFPSSDRFHSILGTLVRINTSLVLWKRETPLCYIRHTNAHSAVVKFIKITLMYYQ